MTGVYTVPASVSATSSDTIHATATVGGVTKTGLAAVTVPTSAQAPTVASPIAITPLSVTQMELSVLGADPTEPEGSLTYTWTSARTGTPPQTNGVAVPPPTFSVNGTNSAKNTTVTCPAGYPLGYIFTVKITDALGLSTTAIPLTLTELKQGSLLIIDLHLRPSRVLQLALQAQLSCDAVGPRWLTVC